MFERRLSVPPFFAQQFSYCSIPFSANLRKWVRPSVAPRFLRNGTFPPQRTALASPFWSDFCPWIDGHCRRRRTYSSEKTVEGSANNGRLLAVSFRQRDRSIRIYRVWVNRSSKHTALLICSIRLLCGFTNNGTDNRSVRSIRSSGCCL